MFSFFFKLVKYEGLNPGGNTDYVIFFMCGLSTALCVLVFMCMLFGTFDLFRYVPWNLHEPEKGVFSFQDQLDLK